MIRKTILVAVSISFFGAMFTSLMAHADSAAPARPAFASNSADGD